MGIFPVSLKQSVRFVFLCPLSVLFSSSESLVGLMERGLAAMLVRVGASEGEKVKLKSGCSSPASSQETSTEQTSTTTTSADNVLPARRKEKGSVLSFSSSGSDDSL